MTLNHGKFHLDQYQNVEYNSIYHHTKFESNSFINIRMHAKVKVL